MPIDFVYDKDIEEFRLDSYESDAELAERAIRKGLTSISIFRSIDGTIKISNIFGGIEPKNFYQNEKTGENNIVSAQAAII